MCPFWCLLTLFHAVVKFSINLALSTRGQEALQRAGDELYKEVMANTIKMHRRVIHSGEGKVAFQPYGEPWQGIHSVGREMLNVKLIDLAATQVDTVTLKFNTTLDKVDRSGSCFFDGKKEPVTSHLVIGADGTYTYVADQSAADDLATGETATDSFTYTVSDGNGGTDTATIVITVTGTNDAPTAADKTIYINENNTDNGSSWIW